MKNENIDKKHGINKYTARYVMQMKYILGFIQQKINVIWK